MKEKLSLEEELNALKSDSVSTKVCASLMSKALWTGHFQVASSPRG